MRRTIYYSPIIDDLHVDVVAGRCRIHHCFSVGHYDLQTLRNDDLIVDIKGGLKPSRYVVHILEVVHFQGSDLGDDGLRFFQEGVYQVTWNKKTKRYPEDIEIL